MKAYFKLFILFFFLTGLTFSIESHCSVPLEINNSNSELYYEWNPSLNAVSYQVTIEHRTTQETFQQTTTDTNVLFTGLTSGTYDITVTAFFANQTSSIIIEDERVL